MWEWLKSILPWHTTHKMDLDAKGVPKEFKVHLDLNAKGIPKEFKLDVTGLSGLSDISRVRLDVRESTRDAWICLIYSASFFLVAVGVSLFLEPLSWLMTSVWGLLGVMISELGPIISSGLKLLGYCNFVMILYVWIVLAFHEPNELGKKHPNCQKILKLFCVILLTQVMYMIIILRTVYDFIYKKYKVIFKGDP